MAFPGLAGQFGCPLTSDFDPSKHESSIGPSRCHSLANAICDEALADAGIDTKDMPIDRDRFGLNLANLFGDEEQTELAYSEGKRTREKMRLFNFVIPSVIAMKHQIYGP